MPEIKIMTVKSSKIKIEMWQYNKYFNFKLLYNDVISFMIEWSMFLEEELGSILQICFTLQTMKDVKLSLTCLVLKQDFLKPSNINHYFSHHLS